MITDKEIRIGMAIGYRGQIITLTKKLLFSPGFDINEIEPILLTKDMAYEMGFVDFPDKKSEIENKWYVYDIFLLQINEYTIEEFQPILEMNRGNYGAMAIDEHDGMIRNPNGHCTLGIYYPEEEAITFSEEDIEDMEDNDDIENAISSAENKVTIPSQMVNFSWNIKYVHQLQNIIYDASKKELTLFGSTLAFILGLGLEPEEYKKKFL